MLTLSSRKTGDAAMLLQKDPEEMATDDHEQAQDLTAADESIDPSLNVPPNLLTTPLRRSKDTGTLPRPVRPRFPPFRLHHHLWLNTLAEVKVNGRTLLMTRTYALPASSLGTADPQTSYASVAAPSACATGALAKASPSPAVSLAPATTLRLTLVGPKSTKPLCSA